VLGASNGDTVQGNIIRGAQSFDNFKQQIDALLAEQAISICQFFLHIYI
jgi:hypothetical protein